MGNSGSKQAEMGQTEKAEKGQAEKGQAEEGQAKEGQAEEGQAEVRQAEKMQGTCKIIAAIDFGTTYTGFAYTFSENMDNIVTGNHGNFLKKDRVPTVLLLTCDDKFSLFGFDAEDEYSGLMIDDRHHQYRLFREFKMKLYCKDDNLHKNITINDTEGRPKKAIEVFSIVIKHLKELILKSIDATKIGITATFESKIEWMLTIPAIWSDSARQFMRLAATQGGIPETNLRLVLEPEAAALFCKSQRLEVTQNVGMTKLRPGTKYILADLGGGTADICAHEILEDEKVRELYRAQGGAFGGLSVNNEFIQFLIKLFSAPVWRKLEKQECYDHIQMMRKLEEQKRKFSFKYPASFIINIPASLLRLLQHDTKSTLDAVVTMSQFSEMVKVLKDNKLVCQRKIMEDFFKPSVEGIVEILREIMNECKNDSIKTLLVVGGHAESEYVREYINKKIKQIKVVVVPEPRLAVLKGAVLMGLEPKDIIQRRARYTYGFSVAKIFIEGTHSEALKFTREGRVLCDKIFSKVIDKDQILTYNDTFLVSTHSKLEQPDSKDVILTVSLYRTDKRQPIYCLDTENCIRIGHITMQPPAAGWSDLVSIENILIMGETEFTVQAKNRSTGEEYETYVDFL